MDLPFWVLLACYLIAGFIAVSRGHTAFGYSHIRGAWPTCGHVFFARFRVYKVLGFGVWGLGLGCKYFAFRVQRISVLTRVWLHACVVFAKHSRSQAWTV